MLVVIQLDFIMMVQICKNGIFKATNVGVTVSYFQSIAYVIQILK